jgi:hypothetical protein
LRLGLVAEIALVDFIDFGVCLKLRDFLAIGQSAADGLFERDSGNIQFDGRNGNNRPRPNFRRAFGQHQSF